MNEDKQGNKVKCREALKASRCSFSKLLAKNQTQVECGVMNQHTLKDVGSSPEKHSPESSRFQTVSKWRFQHHATLPQQIFAAVSANPSAIGIDGFLFFRFSSPVPAATLGFRYV